MNHNNLYLVPFILQFYGLSFERVIENIQASHMQSTGKKNCITLIYKKLHYTNL